MHIKALRHIEKYWMSFTLLLLNFNCFTFRILSQLSRMDIESSPWRISKSVKFSQIRLQDEEEGCRAGPDEDEWSPRTSNFMMLEWSDHFHSRSLTTYLKMTFWVVAQWVRPFRLRNGRFKRNFFYGFCPRPQWWWRRVRLTSFYLNKLNYEYLNHVHNLIANCDTI